MAHHGRGVIDYIIGKYRVQFTITQAKMFKKLSNGMDMYENGADR